jgi:hypothetical protein
MLGMHVADASPDYFGREQLAPSCAQQGGWQGKGRMRWRIAGRDIGGTEPMTYIKGAQTFKTLLTYPVQIA